MVRVAVGAVQAEGEDAIWMERADHLLDTLLELRAIDFRQCAIQVIPAFDVRDAESLTGGAELSLPNTCQCRAGGERYRMYLTRLAMRGADNHDVGAG